MSSTHAWLLENPASNIEVDIESSSITLPDGRSVQYPIDDFARYCLLNGIDQLGFLQNHEEDIQKFEKERSWTP